MIEFESSLLIYQNKLNEGKRFLYHHLIMTCFCAFSCEFVMQTTNNFFEAFASSAECVLTKRQFQLCSLIFALCFQAQCLLNFPNIDYLTRTKRLNELPIRQCLPFALGFLLCRQINYVTSYQKSYKVVSIELLYVNRYYVRILKVAVAWLSSISHWYNVIEVFHETYPGTLFAPRFII